MRYLAWSFFVFMLTYASIQAMDCEEANARVPMVPDPCFYTMEGCND